MKDLAKSLEEHVAQRIYVYETDNESLPTIKIKVENWNLPHLMALSAKHHFGLPSKRPLDIFLGIKRDWTLEKLMEGDYGWFQEAQDKLVGCLFLYQIFNNIECQLYTTFFDNRHSTDRLKRDNTYFVIFRTVIGKSYSVELSPEDPYNIENTYFFPRSLKINDKQGSRGKKLNITKVTISEVPEAKIQARYIKWE